MGYSAGTPMRDEATHAAMLAFAGEHFRPWHKITPEGGWGPDYDWTAYLTADLDYIRKPLYLGFNFNGSVGLVGEYGFAFLRWMALRAGRHKSFKKHTGTSEPVAFMVYDTGNGWPVLPSSEWASRFTPAGRCHLTDDNGFRTIIRPWMPNLGRDGFVETGVALADKCDEGVVRDVLLQFKVPPAQVDELFTEPPPRRILSTNPPTVRRLAGLLKDADVRVTVERGPLVLDGYRLDIAVEEEPIYQKAEVIIREELERLTSLWDARNRMSILA